MFCGPAAGVWSVAWSREWREAQAMEDLSAFCCQNPSCADYGKRGAGNLSVCDRIGKAKQYRLPYCRACKARFSEVQRAEGDGLLRVPHAA